MYIDRKDLKIERINTIDKPAMVCKTQFPKREEKIQDT